MHLLGNRLASQPRFSPCPRRLPVGLPRSCGCHLRGRERMLQSANSRHRHACSSHFIWQYAPLGHAHQHVSHLLAVLPAPAADAEICSGAMPAAALPPVLPPPLMVAGSAALGAGKPADLTPAAPPAAL